MALFLTILLATQLQIPAPVGYVNDFAGVIDDAAEREMLAMIEDVRAKSGGEIVVATLRDLGGRASIDVARDIGREWRVGARGGPGDRARNAGVILLLMPGERPGDGRADLAIATGTGAEGFITDALAGRIRDAIGEAAVDRGSYAAGLLVGVQLLAQAYAQEFGFELSGGMRPAPSGAPPAACTLSMLLTLAVLLLFVAFAIGARASYGSRGYRRYHRGPSGWGWFLLSALTSGGRRGGGWRGGWGGGWSGGGGGGGGGGFGGFGGGGGFSGGGASGRF